VTADLSVYLNSDQSVLCSLKDLLQSSIFFKFCMIRFDLLQVFSQRITELENIVFLTLGLLLFGCDHEIKANVIKTLLI